MIHTSKFINKNFRIKVSGIDNEGNRINKLVGVSGLSSEFDWRNFSR